MGDSVKKIAFVGDYLPRQCGIATFTTDLQTALASRFPETECLVVAVNDREEGYDYPEAVKFEIEERNLDDYRRAAEYLNLSAVDLVCVQHEFGIYGGVAGSHLLTLLREVRMPVVTTLHTILREPNREQREVMEQIVQESARVVVMTQKGADLLREVYGVPAEKVALIAHGIPDFTPGLSQTHKVQFGLENHTVLLTFGLISPGKGIEHVIDALPSIIEAHPDVIYVVLGATHPNLRKKEGEGYRLSLQRRVEALGVAENVRFYDQFVSLDQLLEFIGATDIYVTPYLNEEQITSGTLAYAFGAGKAVVSTPVLAREGVAGRWAGEIGAIRGCRGDRRSGEGLSRGRNPAAGHLRGGASAGAGHDLAAGGGVVSRSLQSDSRGTTSAAEGGGDRGEEALRVAAAESGSRPHADGRDGDPAARGLHRAAVRGGLHDGR